MLKDARFYVVIAAGAALTAIAYVWTQNASGPRPLRGNLQEAIAHTNPSVNHQFVVLSLLVILTAAVLIWLLRPRNRPTRFASALSTGIIILVVTLMVTGVLGTALYFTGDLYRVRGFSPYTPALWVVDDPGDPFPESPYSLDALRRAYTLLPGRTGELIVVTDPRGVEGHLEQDVRITTLVIHINVLDDLDADLIRTYYDRGYAVVTLGAGITVLGDLLGEQERVAGFGEYPADAEFWPYGSLVRTPTGCGAGTQGALYSTRTESWTPLKSMISLFQNRCTEQSRRNPLT